MSKTVERNGYIITVALLGFDMWTYVVTKGSFYQTGPVTANDSDEAIEAALKDVEAG